MLTTYIGKTLTVGNKTHEESFVITKHVKTSHGTRFFGAEKYNQWIVSPDELKAIRQNGTYSCERYYITIK